MLKKKEKKSTKIINFSGLVFMISSNILIFDYKNSSISWFLLYLFEAVPPSYPTGCLPAYVLSMVPE